MVETYDTFDEAKAHAGPDDAVNWTAVDGGRSGKYWVCPRNLDEFEFRVKAFEVFHGFPPDEYQKQVLREAMKLRDGQ